MVFDIDLGFYLRSCCFGIFSEILLWVRCFMYSQLISLWSNVSSFSCCSELNFGGCLWLKMFNGKPRRRNSWPPPWNIASNNFLILNLQKRTSIIKVIQINYSYLNIESHWFLRCDIHMTTSHKMWRQDVIDVQPYFLIYSWFVCSLGYSTVKQEAQKLFILCCQCIVYFRIFLKPSPSQLDYFNNG